MTVFLVYSFLSPGLFRVSLPMTFENYRLALASSLNRTLSRNSLVIGMTSASATVLISIPIGYWLRYSAGRWRLPVIFLITASMFASYLVRIYAWRSILGANGLLNRGLEALGVIDQPVDFLLFNRLSVAIAMIHLYLPVAVLMIFAAFGPVSFSLLEAAEDLGASARQRWRRVLLPLIAAPAVTALVLIFVLSASDYVTPQLIGGTDGVMLGVQIQTQFKAIGNWPLGAATSFLMLGAFLTLYGIAILALRAAGLDRIEWRS